MNADNFDEIIRNNQFVIVDCWTPWCSLCLYYDPLLDDLARKYIDKFVCGKLDLSNDENREIAIKFQVTGIPTLLVFKNGKLIQTVVGVIPMRKLEPILLELMAEKKHGKKK